MQAKPPWLFNQARDRNLMFSLPLAGLILLSCLSLQNNLPVDPFWIKRCPQPFLQKRINLDLKVPYNLSSIYHSGLTFHYFLYTDIDLSSNSTNSLIFLKHTLSISSFHVLNVLSTGYTPASHFNPSYLHFKTQLKCCLQHGVVSEGPCRYVSASSQLPLKSDCAWS